jgi:hypothetical protein
MRVIMDLKLARACAQDAGNRNMRKNGRKEWNEEDWNIATAMLNKLWPINPKILETLK